MNVIEGKHTPEEHDLLSARERSLLGELSQNENFDFFIMPIGIGELVMEASEKIDANPADFATDSLRFVMLAILQGGTCLQLLHASMMALKEEE